MRRFLLIAIRIYQLTLSPFLGRSCRFVPTCSCYAAQAIERFGASRGAWLGLRRVLRCHPWHEAGYDPVPLTDGNEPAATVQGIRHG
jgi:putative membrane protein insertion efficiency factor